MSATITSEEKAELEREREREEREKESQRRQEERDWNMELYKMAATLAINIFVISVLILGALYTTGDISSRFMAMLELVIGAIFGVTATQIAGS